MRKILLSTLATALLSATAAHASNSDYYVKALLGYNQLNKTNNASAKKSASYGIGAGYYAMDNLRTDFTFERLINNSFKDGTKKIKGDANTFLLNGFVDIFDISLFNVFIGAGIGLGQVKAEISGDTNAANNGYAKSKYNTAYATYIGTSIEFFPKLNAELIYSYKIIGKSKEVNNKSVKLSGHNVSVGLRLDI
ncbi:MAG: outer membrane beta-barrel protein [Rickettsiaceae bacterium]|nr:outer membrane beta-barrel protein [Rickettsiaceae bacterium]